MGNEPRLGSKVFYKIGEVSKISKLPAYVLRFWESEFSFLRPKKSRGNQRLYVQKDVDTVLADRKSTPYLVTSTSSMRTGHGE